MPTLKCSRCGYVFLLPGAKKQPAPRTRRKPGDDDGKAQLALGGDLWQASELSKDRRRDDDRSDDDFVLDDEDEAYELDAERPAEEPEADEERDDDELTEEPSAEEFVEEESVAEDEPTADEPTDDAEENDQARQAAPAEPAVGAASDPSDADDRSDRSVGSVRSSDESEAPPRRRRSRKSPPPPPPPAAAPLTPWLGFAAAVLVAYLVVAWSFVARPALADRVLGSLPAFADLDPSALLASRIHLSALDGAYQLIGDRETAFVVSGFATSTASQPLRDVQIRGRLLGAEGQVLAEKSVYCGVATTPPVLSDLDSREISVLQRIQPPPRFAISPGDDARFLLAFVDPPEGVARYALEVISASPVQR